MFVFHRQQVSLASLLVLLAGCGGDSGPPDDDNQNPPPGGGTPAGDPVTAQIGPGGGTISTADGGISLVFPAGALATPTDVTIRPMVNTAPGGVGLAYRIEPAGLAIAQPVELTLGVSSALLGDAQIGELGVGLRSKAGDWYTDMGSSATAAVRTGAATTPGVSRIMDGGSVTTTLTSGLITETSVVTYWRVLPRRPRIKTTEHVTITVEACFLETENTSYWNEDGVTITSRRRTRTCGPSVRQGTWSVASLTGQTASADVGTVVAGTPTSVATYTAPARHPPGGGVVVTAHLYWAEMNLTADLPILVQVEQSNAWGGTVNWTISGTDVKHFRNDNPSLPYVDVTTTLTREGSGQVQLIAIPGRASPAVALLDPSSIVATDHFKRVVVTITRGGGCETTKTETWDVSGNHSEFPTNPPMGGIGEVSILFGDGNEYAIGFISVQWEATGTYTIQSTTACTGDDEVLPGLPVSTEITYNLGPEMAGGFDSPDGLYHAMLNPAAPHVLEGSAPWRDGIHPWATTKVTWSITRPQ